MIFSIFFVGLLPGAHEFIRVAHTKDFTEAGDSALDLLSPILSERLHPGVDGRRLQRPRGHTLLDQVPDRLGHSKNLEDARPSGKSGDFTLCVLS